MSFINKKEEVINISLTQHGKHLLSRGLFRPECYSFFDDDIIYDISYCGVAEHQNNSETRIKESPRTTVQHLSNPVSSSYAIETEELRNSSTENPVSEFDSLIYPMKEIDRDKILGFPLTNMSLGTQEAPRFELKVFESEIENSSSLSYDMLDSSRIRIPQLDFEPEHVLVRDTTAVNPLAPQGQLLDDESFEVNPILQKIEFLDGSFLEHKPESVCILLEEFNVPFLSENFEIEVFEVKNKDTNTEYLVPIKEWEKMFDIRLDDSVSKVPVKNKQRNNFF